MGQKANPGQEPQHAYRSPEPGRPLASVINRFRMVATAPHRERTFPVGAESAKWLGYDAAVVDTLPPTLTESFCGVGNPFALGEPQPDHVVLDLGCGAGFDTLLAAQSVGPNGKVIGLDLLSVAWKT